MSKKKASQLLLDILGQSFVVKADFLVTHLDQFASVAFDLSLESLFLKIDKISGAYYNFTIPIIVVFTLLRQPLQQRHYYGIEYYWRLRLDIGQEISTRRTKA